VTDESLLTFVKEDEVLNRLRSHLQLAEEFDWWLGEVWKYERANKKTATSSKIKVLRVTISFGKLTKAAITDHISSLGFKEEDGTFSPRSVGEQNQEWQRGEFVAIEIKQPIESLLNSNIERGIFVIEKVDKMKFTVKPLKLHDGEEGAEDFEWLDRRELPLENMSIRLLFRVRVSPTKKVSIVCHIPFELLKWDLNYESWFEDIQPVNVDPNFIVGQNYNLKRWERDHPHYADYTSREKSFILRQSIWAYIQALLTPFSSWSESILMFLLGNGLGGMKQLQSMFDTTEKWSVLGQSSHWEIRLHAGPVSTKRGKDTDAGKASSKKRKR
jgi:hypothetical protein